MPATTATAPGKCILFGEHAVVYNRPAIAVPINQVSVRATIVPLPGGSREDIWIEAPAIHLSSRLDQLSDSHPIKITLLAIQDVLKCSNLPPLRLIIKSTIPPASGMGSSAAVAVAICRSLPNFLGHPLDPPTINQIAYLSERRQHGNPSGIDNTVITYQQPIYFIKGHPWQLVHVKQPFTLIIADTGEPSPTGKVVSDVRRRWEDSPDKFETLFTQVAQITDQARTAIEHGKIEYLGSLLSQNHILLQEMTVSSTKLDLLVSTSLQSGALGAKLSGGGRGGNMIALVAPEKVDNVADALKQAGASQTIIFTIPITS